jgi:hypothetical protein
LRKLAAKPPLHNRGASDLLPHIVEAHLRANRNLKPETAKALAELFRLAYKQFAGAEGNSEKGQ